MNDRLKRFFRPDNIPLILAIVISLGFFIYETFQPNPDVGNRVIVAVLGTLAFGLLAERLGYFERIENGINQIRNQKKTLLVLPVTWENFDAYCSSATEVFVSGASLGQLVPRNKALFEKMAERGCKFRFVLLNPDSPALPAVAKWAGASPERFKGAIEESLSDLQYLKGQYDKIVEVKLNDSIPALTIMGFNPKEVNGRIRVDLNLYQCPKRQRPYFELTHSPENPEEEERYQIFLSQFERLWKSIP